MVSFFLFSFFISEGTKEIFLIWFSAPLEIMDDGRTKIDVLLQSVL